MIALRSVPTGPDKAAFHRYLDDFDGADDEPSLLASLAECGELLPARYADLLGLPATATYRDAIRLLLARWQPTLRTPSPQDDE